MHLIAKTCFTGFRVNLIHSKYLSCMQLTSRRDKLSSTISPQAFSCLTSNKIKVGQYRPTSHQVHLKVKSLPNVTIGKKELLVQNGWKDNQMDLMKWPLVYASLSKWYLTWFVVMTADAGYCLAPVPFEQSTFLLVTLGTALCSCSANTLNQIAEVPYDAQMDRTRNRPLVKGIISPLHAFLFAVVTGSTGVACLYQGVNGLTAALGFTNLALYAGVYTALKRKHWFNTWVGAVVGSIPPLMGWTAATGSLDSGAMIFAGILYAWQFPHFYALAWRRRGDYARGSYHMLPLSHPTATKYVVLFHTGLLWSLCLAAPVTGVTTLWFVAMSTPINLWLSYKSYRFHRETNSNSALQLYKCSLYYLLLISLALVVDRKVLSKMLTKDNNNDFSLLPVKESIL
uniref:Protoheme IX farnesyltransferase, mitochondrial n=1 Tax=Ciona savignyi TaxID=51511 RepID=H2Z6I3_CIOSA